TECLTSRHSHSLLINILCFHTQKVFVIPGVQNVTSYLALRSWDEYPNWCRTGSISLTVSPQPRMSVEDIRWTNCERHTETSNCCVRTSLRHLKTISTKNITKLKRVQMLAKRCSKASPMRFMKCVEVVRLSRLRSR